MERHAAYTRLVRERNKVVHAIETAAETFEETLRHVSKPGTASGAAQRPPAS
jgi:hypothetical protein